MDAVNELILGNLFLIRTSDDTYESIAVQPVLKLKNNGALQLVDIPCCDSFNTDDIFRLNIC